MMQRTRAVVVCADDAGWDADSDDLIAGLARSARISAISVLVEGRHAAGWTSRDPGPTCAMGLHLALTWSAEGRSGGLGRVVGLGLARRLPSAWVETRALQQLVRFETLFARPPDFVDGHQHVQMLTGVRGPLVALLTRRYGGSRPAIRVPFGRSWRGTKSEALNLLGARQLERELGAASWPRNTDFAGAYDLDGGRDFGRRMRSWLASLRHGGLIMVHPGRATLGEHSVARAREADYLGGETWLQDRAAAKVRLVPFTASAMLAAAASASSDTTR